jgi:hypothetical protein
MLYKIYKIFFIHKYIYSYTNKILFNQICFLIKIYIINIYKYIISKVLISSFQMFNKKIDKFYLLKINYFFRKHQNY